MIKLDVKDEVYDLLKKKSKKNNKKDVEAFLEKVILKGLL